MGAMEWALQEGRCASSPSSRLSLSSTSLKGSVAGTRNGCSNMNSTASQFLESVSPSPGSPAAVVTPKSVGSRSGGVATPTGLSNRLGAGHADSGDADKVATELQLDDILKDFDEIESVYDGICKL